MQLDPRADVRFWRVLDSGAEGRPVGLGSASQGSGVTLSRDTGQVTHRISPVVDTERYLLVADLVRAKVVTRLYEVSGVGPTMSRRNGEGDPYVTDGEIRFAVLSPGAVLSSGAVLVSAPPVTEADPQPVQGKDSVWDGLESLLAPVPEG